MSLQTYAWIVLLAPLAGAIFIGLTFRLLPWKVHGWIGTLAIALSFLAAVGALFALQDLPEEERQVVSLAWNYGNTVGVDAQFSLLIDPLSVFMILVGLRRLGADPPLLGRLHGVRRRLLALLRVPELLRLLDAAAGPGRQLRDPDHRLGLRRRGLLPADLVLVPARDGDEGGHQGVRHQRGRRHRPRARDVLHLQARRVARLPHGVRARGRVPVATTATSSRAACCCSSAPSPSRRRSRSTPGSRTPWRARRRSPP